MELEEILERMAVLLDERRWTEVRQTLDGLPVQDIAWLLLQLEKSRRIFLFKLLPRGRASEVFAYFSAENQDALLQDMTDQETREVIAGLSPDDRTALFEELPAQATQRLLELLPPGAQRETRQLLGYPEESVGRLMTPDYLAVRADWTVARSLQHIRNHREKAETVNVIYVTNPQGRLLDALTIRQLIVAEPETEIEALMDHHFICVSAFDDREKAVETVQHYDLTALPVVDSDGILLGIVTLDDVMDVAELEATEDFHKMGSVSALNLSMRDAKPSLLYRRRVGWLLILVAINMLSGQVIAAYEEIIEAIFVLALFMPLVVDTSGNAGTQAATLMVRALATGDVKPSDWLRLWGKEASVALALGLTIGAAVWLVGLWRADGNFDIALAMAVAMVLVVFMGSMIGMLLPFILARFNLDPATASAPLITSIADVAGFVIYFAVAAAMLGHLLPGAAG